MAGCCLRQLRVRLEFDLDVAKVLTELFCFIQEACSRLVDNGRSAPNPKSPTSYPFSVHCSQLSVGNGRFKFTKPRPFKLGGSCLHHLDDGFEFTDKRCLKNPGIQAPAE